MFLGLCPLFFCFLDSMVGSSKVRILFPSVSFLFARLGVSLGVSHTFCPLVEGFVFGVSSLSVVLADLFPLLCQSVDWFEELVGEQRVMLEVRFGELEMELSSSKNPMEIEEDITAFGPWEIRAFHALREVCGLNTDALSRFRDRFQFPKRVRVHLP